jgi:hypothetical protein
MAEALESHPGTAVVRTGSVLLVEPPLADLICVFTKIAVPVGSLFDLSVRVTDSHGGIDDDQISFTCVS